MIVVTGAAGFIGSCIVAGLNERGREDLILVDELDEAKRKNLQNKKYLEYRDKKDFLELILRDQFKERPEAVIHMGACSSTTLQDARYFKENNLEYTRSLAQWALRNNVRFIYASSAATYGDGSAGYKDDEATIRRCKPLNLYGQSKQDFDLWVLEQGLQDKVAGLKFFNVFGPNEYHKGDMRSVVAKAYQRVAEEGKIALFKSYRKDYKDGEQKRDFIYVKDAVDIVLFFLDHPRINGIFNVGTGKASTWNELAGALFAAVGKKPDIQYIEMPADLERRYQYFTQADMVQLRKSGYAKPFTPLEEAVADYARYLKDHRYW
ncbi:MAG TPA: ADP-glyceromanno-heptose 6-epimerase [Candidatus Omnitrophica bacterium]|nr:MAG: ADP-glyceromanno-heptose 6-epimerase [Omnitrophica WOR_2 bacterium GWA2_53_43]HCI45180.1 ADP-glyceromanno-heptose 6-epimerase [Candidatus Omnitrophota bacterium]